jgi:hypothetical protein
MKARNPDRWMYRIVLVGASLQLANWDDQKAYLDVQTQVGQTVRLIF